MKNMISLTNNNTTKNMRSSLNFAKEYNSENVNAKNIASQPRIINNEKNNGFIAASHAHTKNMQKNGK